MMEKELKACITITMLMREGESVEEAEARLKNLLCEALQMNFNHTVDYNIDSMVVDG